MQLASLMLIAASYLVDSSHTTAGFAVKHMMVATVRGQFDTVAGKVEIDDADLTRCRIDVTIEAASVNTRNAKRDVMEKKLYFHEDGRLSFEPPAGVKPGHDSYISDPARPVPYRQRPIEPTYYPKGSGWYTWLLDDQRFAARRPDVLVYQSEPLAEDVTIAGPISPRLSVASTGTDSDFVVKLIDVYPNDYPDNEVANTTKRVLGPPSVRMGGYQQLLRGEPMRAKFRNSWEKPEPLIPGKISQVDFTMPDLNHTFRKGHRIMIQIQSSWFPLVDRNPQTFVEIPDARPEDFKKATEQVFHRKSAASGVELLVLNR